MKDVLDRVKAQKQLAPPSQELKRLEELEAENRHFKSMIVDGRSTYTLL